MGSINLIFPRPTIPTVQSRSCGCPWQKVCLTKQNLQGKMSCCTCKNCKSNIHGGSQFTGKGTTKGRASKPRAPKPQRSQGLVGPRPQIAKDFCGQYGSSTPSPHNSGTLHSTSTQAHTAAGISTEALKRAKQRRPAAEPGPKPKHTQQRHCAAAPAPKLPSAHSSGTRTQALK